jgi:DNA helicase-2/ATP-dependent DNA helicase PcrA
MSPVNLLDGLNVQQQQAVMAGLGPILVLAGPGSGKTRVLTHRIAYLIGSMGVRPYHILAVTFTNKAAREMEARVKNLLGEEAHGVTLGTFHATCARILRREAEQFPFNSNFVIFDADDQLSLVRRAIADLNLDDKLYRPQAVHAAISSAKNELILPDTFPQLTYRDEVYKRVYTRYQQFLLANNAVDFDDLLLYTAMLMDENLTIREKYARRFEQVLVDEFQDTNMAQYLLLKHLSSFHHNIFVVGDADQSIYRWRGADYRNVLRFEKDFPDAQVILLEQNYRSTQPILDVAMSVIDRNPQRKPKRLFTERNGGLKPDLHEAYDDRTEASYVVDTIVSLVAKREHEPGDFAIMYRTNAQSRLLEEAFLHAGLPYKLVGAQRFYGRREIKDIIAYLRLVHNPSDEVSLTRIINVPTRGIGDKTVQTLRAQASKAGISPGQLLLDLAKADSTLYHDVFTSRILSALVTFAKRLDSWRTLSAESAPLYVLDRILDDIQYRTYVDDGTEEGNDRWENVMELRRLAAEYQERSLVEFLEDVTLVSDQDTLNTAANVPTLLTLHAAKGLEFPIVFIVGLNDGTLPHARSFDDAEAMHEERRLLYVGITRAEDRLYLVYAQNRSAFGYSEPVDPSRFLADIPQTLLEDSARARTTRQSSREPSWSSPAPSRWNQKSVYSAKAEGPRFKAGMRVQHPVWGEGMVLNSRMQDEDEIVDVFFENMGLKRVSASLAKLEPK